MKNWAYPTNRNSLRILFLVVISIVSNHHILPAQDCFPSGSTYGPTLLNEYDNFFFGTSLEVNENDQVVVGNPLGVSDLDGAIYFYTQDSDGLDSTTLLTSPHELPSYSYGTSIALSSSWIVVGAPKETNSTGSSGSVYLYKIENSLPYLFSELQPSSDSTHGFGESVAIHKNEVQVISKTENSDSSFNYQVEIFRLDDQNHWNHGQVLQIPSQENSNCSPNNWNLKVDLSSHEHFLAVGITEVESQGYPPPSGTLPCQLGEVWVFQKDPQQQWQLDTHFMPPEDSDPYSFGSALDVDMNQILVGAPQTGGLGKAYVFEKEAGGIWNTNHLPLILDPDGFGPGPESNFGESVQIDGRRAAVGFPQRADSNLNLVEGVVLFERASQGEWNPVSQFLGPTAGTGFGRDLALAKEILIVSQNSFAFGMDTLAMRYECIFPTQSYVRGDLNGDVSLDLSDPVLLLMILSVDQPIECLESADCDLNGQLDLGDVITLLNYLYLPESPPAFLNLGQCVEDLPSEALDCNSLNPCSP